MIRLLFLVGIVGAVAFFVLREMLKFRMGISTSKSVIRNDMKRLKEIVEQFELSPIKMKEVDLLSKLHEAQAENDLVTETTEGIFYSIYHEPIMAFASKEYRESNRRIAAVQFNHEVYEFFIQGEEAIVSQDSEPIGKIDFSKGISLKTKDQSLMIDTQSTSSLLPVRVDGKHLWSLEADIGSLTDQSRIINVLEDFSEEEGRLMLLALSFALVDKQM